MADSSKILIVEDEALIALDLEMMFKDHGMSNIHVFAAAKPAETWLNDHTPDLAILDYYLSQSTSESVADVLVKKNVPFIVCSAAEKQETSSAFDAGYWMAKPYDYDKIILAALELLHDRQQTGASVSGVS